MKRYVVTLILSLLSALPGNALAGFTESAALYGIDNGPMMSWSGGFVDFDGDGDLDLYVGNHWEGQANLYRNDGGFLADYSDHYWSWREDRHGSFWADLNNDGTPDQYTTKCRWCPNELYWNRGGGVLEEGGAQSGVADEAERGREVALADFDSDGRLDILLANNERSDEPYPGAILWNDGDENFTRVTDANPLHRGRVHCTSADIDLDGLPDIVMSLPYWKSGELYLNKGSRAFTDGTADAFAGITEPLRHAQAMSWADYDNDGDLDLVAAGGGYAMWDHAALEGDSIRFSAAVTEANDAGLRQKSVWFTTSADSFTLFAQKYNYLELPCYAGSLGVVASTYPKTLALSAVAGNLPVGTLTKTAMVVTKRDGPTVDTIFVAVQAGLSESNTVGGSIRAAGGTFLSWGTAHHGPLPDPVGSNHRNRLYRNEGDRKFAEVTDIAFDVNDSTHNSTATAWGDYDNDGWVDLYITNGGDIEKRDQPNLLYHNNGDGTFTEIAAAQGLAGSPVGMADGASWGDINGDGFLDLFVANGAEFPPFGNGPRELFINTPNGNHSATFRLLGTTSNGSGIGARLRFVTSSGIRWRTLLGNSDNGFWNFPGIHVGLGADSVCDTVQIFWPSGWTDTHTNVAADTIYWAIEREPLRFLGNGDMVIAPTSVVDTLEKGTVAHYRISTENRGGSGVRYVSSIEHCSMIGDPWTSLAKPTGPLWPNTPATTTDLIVNTSSLSHGEHCSSAIFFADDGSKPDTVAISIFVVDPAVGAPGADALPRNFAIQLQSPNPSLGNLSFDISVPSRGDVEISVFDIRGRQVRSILSGAVEAGIHRLHWKRCDRDGNLIAPGIYFIRATSGRESVTRKVLVVD